MTPRVGWAFVDRTRSRRDKPLYVPGTAVPQNRIRELDLETTDVTFHRALLDLSCLWQLMALDRPDLKDEGWPPVVPGRITAAEVSGTN